VIISHCHRPKMENELASVVQAGLCGTRGTNDSVASDRVVHNLRRIEWSCLDPVLTWRTASEYGDPADRGSRKHPRGCRAFRL
jgi:hypothetical protein